MVDYSFFARQNLHLKTFVWSWTAEYQTNKIIEELKSELPSIDDLKSTLKTTFIKELLQRQIHKGLEAAHQYWDNRTEGWPLKIVLLNKKRFVSLQTK